jgi:hypothetical protein
MALQDRKNFKGSERKLVLSGHLPKRAEESHGNPVRGADIPSEMRTLQLPSMNQSDRYANPFCKK